MIVDWKKRLDGRIEELGLTRAEVLRRAGLNKGFFVNLEKGKSQFPGIDSLVALANAVGWSLWNLLGEETGDGLRLMLQHRIRANEMWQDGSGRPREVPLSVLSQDLISLEVETDEYRIAGYRRGDIVSGARSFGRHIDNLIGLDCIVETSDGQKLFKVLAKGSIQGRYTLKSFNPQNEDMADVRIKWAAPVQMILRGML